MQTVLSSPLNNAQLEVLKLFTRNFSEEEILELKRLIVHFLAGKAMDAADKAWEEHNYSQEDMNRLLLQHERLPYTPKAGAS